MKKIRLLTGLAAGLMMFGCGSGKKVAGGCGSDSALQFRVASVKDGLPLDSLYLVIHFGDAADSQQFKANLKTGVSSASINAAQGQSYKLTFQLFSAGHKIADGEESGSLSCDLDVSLNPLWDTVQTNQAEKDLNQGVLLPLRLSEFFTQALPGKYFELPLDSGQNYHWYLKLRDTTIAEDSGSAVRVFIADSLAGKTVTLRLQARSGQKILEERAWPISVLSALPKDALSRILVRSDTGSKVGMSSTCHYANGHLVLVEDFPVLSPASDAKPVGVESLFYDDKGRAVRTKKIDADSSLRDSLFTYDADGLLSVLVEDVGGEKITDSLWYKGGKLDASRRAVNGKVTESATYTWTAADRRNDSVFTPASPGAASSNPALTRVIQNQFKNDSLIQRETFAGKDASEPYKKEIFTYNALGGRAYEESYSEGFTSTLEGSASYSYDDKGRLILKTITDEVNGVMLGAISFQYAAAAAKPSASAVYASKGVSSNMTASVLDQIRFTHEGWKFPRDPGSERSR